MLRVFVDGVGYVGPVEVTPTLTLADLRGVLAQTFDADSLPQHFQYLVGPGGVTLGSRKEATTLAWALRPSITLLGVSESPVAVPVCVTLWTGAHTFAMWALPSCTVAGEWRRR